MGSLKDVAKSAGVSIRTVSRVLKGEGYVGMESRTRVLKAAQEVGYKPNLAARTLKMGRSFQVAAIVGSMDELHVEKLAGFERTMRTAGYSVQVFFSHKDEADGMAVLEAALMRRPAGVAVFPESGLRLGETAGRLREEGVALMAVDSGAEEVDAIRIDRQQGVYEAVMYLAGKGRKRIAYVGHEYSRTRLDGYERALRDLGMPPVTLKPETGANEYERGRNSAADFLAISGRPDAAQVFSDVLAAGFMAGLHERGVRIPEDVAVVGFDGREFAAMLWPRLTTVEQPNDEVGEAAARALLGKMRGEPAPADGWSRSMPTRLVVRESA